MNKDIAPLCACGCGNQTRKYTKTNNKKNRKMGEWGKYIRGHWSKTTGIDPNLSSTDRLEYMRQWRIKNIEKCLVRDREKYRIMRQQVLSHYSQGKMCCACCGERGIEFLTIDHIIPVRRKNNDVSKNRNTVGTGLYARLRATGFPSGYQVLCFNCNCAKRTSGECPHKRKTLKAAA